MKREVRITADGSHTVAIPEWKVTYHSHHGAIQESVHVFIEAGLHFAWEKFPGQIIYILEIGFGTGLNALLSLQQAILHNKFIHYTTVEKLPLAAEEIAQINHGNILSMKIEYNALHDCEWETPVSIHSLFTLEKKKITLPSTIPVTPVHCIYFDAFAPAAQPELWSQAMFENMYNCLAPGGILVTYCSKSDVRRAMTAAGFSVQKIPGPRGKREMVRAIKNIV